MDDLINGYLCEKESLSLRFMMEKGYSRSGNVGNNDPDLLEAVSRSCAPMALSQGQSR